VTERERRGESESSSLHFEDLERENVGWFVLFVLCVQERERERERVSENENENELGVCFEV
jgi:hypothetical protein